MDKHYRGNDANGGCGYMLIMTIVFAIIVGVWLIVRTVQQAGGPIF